MPTNCACAQSVPSSVVVESSLVPRLVVESSFCYHTCRLVKLSSPYLNVIITVGAMFFYVDVIISGVDANTGSFNTEDIICRYHLFPQTLRLGCVPFKILAGHLSKTSIIMLYAVDRENFAVK